MPKTTSELEVERLIRDSKTVLKIHGYGNWKLKDVPIEIIWNEFANSNVRLEIGDIK